ncbi:hypothetical protein [Taibaiella soli]|uniref:HEXXH motif domain-containing protein n=1 Tax=Taibaiella soli TaxID=1649169 RepID=A0A2W2B8K6_9BACT|nr:hypothetical protein [Taibaiella soli]PZF72297.1 hypothetical protein DN068_13130 [Taibaiella soli]
MILDFEVDISFLENNLIEFANTIRTLLFEENESIFEFIDIESDEIFLEPSLFSYFLNKNLGGESPSLLQLLWGYMHPNKRPSNVEVIADSGGIVVLPNYGYIVWEPRKRGRLFWDKEQGVPYLKESNLVVDVKILAPKFLEGSNIRLAINQPEFLFLDNGTDISEQVLNTTERFTSTINVAWRKMKTTVGDFTSFLERTNRELILFNSATQYSRASYSYYGTAFINVCRKMPTEVFFIDDIAHQCGHVLFYALSLPSDIFLKHAVGTPLREFNRIDWETRDIYGCFHGLFTYTTIVFCLDKFIEQEQKSANLKQEAIGRLCFYMDKFRRDLAHMHNGRILTEKGFEYFDMFQSGYDRILKKYKHYIRGSDFSNQSYLFDFSAYNLLNETKLFS